MLGFRVEEYTDGWFKIQHASLRSGNDMSRKCPISYIFNVSLTVLNALLQQPDVFWGVRDGIQ